MLPNLKTLLNRHQDQSNLEDLHAQVKILWEWVRSLESEIERLHYDQKTGAIRGDLYLSETEKFFAYAKKFNSPIAVFLSDLDDFKIAQDSRSHSWGDAVLKETVKEIKKNLRVSDLVFRYGAGDEFLIVAMCDSHQHALQIRDRLEKGMAGKTISDGEFSGIVGMTVGMVFADKNFHSDLINQADADLYPRKQQKKVGR